MKILPPLLLLLLVLAVLATGTIESGMRPPSDMKNAGIVDRIIAELNWEINGLTRPFATACNSPVFSGYELLMSSGESSKDLDHCIQFVAVQAGDTAQCEGIERGAPRTKCYCLIASKKNDPAICDQVPATDDMQAYLKIDCLWEVAIKNNNPAACDAMGNEKISRMFIGEMSRQTCRQRLASGQGVGESTL
ncbi:MULTISPECIES: hypothetical protein [unclassified Methanoregula]|uniref:hypothetical protein n=1 Tax=unclassified Methanoregula TaxID=2649730 RepID=UPI0009D12832|nr:MULTISPECIES: hypothetical protein [unclassified Methanoregula]OPX62266.1 MAG: hypothetical protein A4E33_02335 [Methanoregula sp. PtaB.Bin085]OPY32693.1 MAG: hypothetical protein A4E34_02069 [Methanoregula sp. PtaU1.Bin006]